MLNLTRKVNEAIIINDNIIIEVLETRESKVKLGLIAPKNIKILRKEVYDEIIKSNKSSIKNESEIATLKNLLSKESIQES
ncbi:carbon storage regulator CsrA [Candidatus Epulonipiscium viviparus]|uniref:carbon storage regulator CsrA n=1 Tax=Candidatus Epulonipiscium viviparus TaxID=420336 RepID=UPI00016BFB09|nr:carbon storage regulator CsrA [Candidatus Epulopiscium viviparus]